MNIKDIEQLFAGLPIGSKIRHFESIDSTNSFALEEVRRGHADHGDIFLSDVQTGGRGQSGNKWQSLDALGLWMSFVLIGDIPVSPLAFLPCVAIHDFLHQDLNLDPHLKWPNDVLVGKKKIAGVLAEGTTNPQGHQGWVIGIGLNLFQKSFTPELSGKATSVVMEAGTCPRRNEVLLSLIGWLNGTISGDKDLISPWMARSRMPGRTLKFRRANQEWEAQVQGLTAEGYLQIQHLDGTMESIISSHDLTIPTDY